MSCGLGSILIALVLHIWLKRIHATIKEGLATHPTNTGEEDTGPPPPAGDLEP